MDNSPFHQLHPHERLLVLLKTRGPSNAAELGRRLDITAEAVRQQLLRLQAEDLVEATAQAKGRGRPLQVWKLTPVAQRRFPDSHAELAAALIKTIRNTLGELALERVIEARGEQLLDSYSAALRDATRLEDRVAGLVSLRNAEGYMAEARSDKGGFRIIQNHCPICAASGLCSSLCRSEQDLFSKVLGPKVIVNREEHIGSGGRRCVYRVQKKPAKAATRRTGA